MTLLNPYRFGGSGIIHPLTAFGASDKGQFFDIDADTSSLFVNTDRTGGTPNADDGIGSINNLNTNVGHWAWGPYSTAMRYRTSPIRHGHQTGSTTGRWEQTLAGNGGAPAGCNVLGNQPFATFIFAVCPADKAERVNVFLWSCYNTNAFVGFGYTATEQLVVNSRRQAGASLVSLTSTPTYANTWHVVTILANPGNDSLKVRVNGAEILSGSYGGQGNFANEGFELLRIGADDANPDNTGWKVTEVRFAAVMGINKDLGSDLAGIERWFGQRCGVSF